MHKIYSRFRFNLPFAKNTKIRNFKYNSFNEKNKITKEKIRKTSIIFAIFIIAYFTADTISGFINPILESKCEAEASSIATIISNQESTKAIANYKYEDIFDIEKDNNGKIIMIKSNVITINDIISNVGLFIQQELNKEENSNIKIPLGSLLGSRLLSGTGPNINVRLICEGKVDTDLRSEFISKGINQTLHRVYLQVDCKVGIITSFETIERNISNQVLLMENVIIGEIPETYYNLEGIEDPTEVIQ